MFETLIIIGLIALNGIFALSELAVVSARRSRVRAFADAGVWGARRALQLAADPGRFLSTVQIGITMVGVVAGAFSGATLGGRLGVWFQGLGLSQVVAEPLGFGLVVAAVTFLSIVFGELLPKQLALRQPERVACRVAPFMSALSQAAWPAVWLLQATTRAVFWLVGIKAQPEEKVSEEEVKALIAEAERTGSIERSEKNLIAGVLRLGDRPVTGVMTPRIEVQWIDLNESEAELQAALALTAHSRLPVGEGSIDALIGVVPVRELLADALAGRPFDVRKHVRQALVVPASSDALDVLEKLRSAQVPVALVHDEYGSFEGLVTPADLLETIAGSFRSHYDESEVKVTERADGSFLLAGAMAADEMADLLAIALPQDRQFHTAAGFVLNRLQRIPRTGEHFEAGGWRFEVVDLDGNRIDKILVTRPTTGRRLI